MEDQIKKAGAIVNALQSSVKKYRIAVVAMTIAIILSGGLHLRQNHLHKNKLTEAAALFDQIMVAHKQLQDTLKYTIGQRNELIDQRDMYIAMYERAMLNLELKDGLVEEQKRTIYALRTEIVEKSGEFEMLAARYEKRYIDMQAIGKKIDADERGINRVSYSIDSLLKCSHRGDYLSFKNAKAGKKYLITVYPMGSAMPYSIRQGSTINGMLVVNIAELLNKNDIVLPYVVEVTYGSRIEWQYKAIREFPEGALASSVEPVSRKHVYSTNGTRGEDG